LTSLCKSAWFCIRYTNSCSCMIPFICFLHELLMSFKNIFNKYETFFVLIYSYINTSGNWENEKLHVWKLYFHTISSFPNFHVCWYNCISIRKSVLYIFYNIAQRNIKKAIFRVDIELYQHGS
jgi:hypothetical protein